MRAPVYCRKSGFGRLNGGQMVLVFKKKKKVVLMCEAAADAACLAKGLQLKL